MCIPGGSGGGDGERGELVRHLLQSLDVFLDPLEQDGFGLSLSTDVHLGVVVFHDV